MRLLALVALTVVACGPSEPESGVEAPPAQDRPAPSPSAPAPACEPSALTEDLETHACFHVEKGPRATVTAAREGDAPPVSKSHTEFTVEVPGGDARWVSFRSKVGGLYAFYSGPKARMVARSEAGEVLAPTCEGETSGACAALPYQVQIRVAANETVKVALFPEADAGQVKLIVESME